MVDVDVDGDIDVVENDVAVVVPWSEGGVPMVLFDDAASSPPAVQCHHHHHHLAKSHAIRHPDVMFDPYHYQYS